MCTFIQLHIVSTNSTELRMIQLSQRKSTDCAKHRSQANSFKVKKIVAAFRGIHVSPAKHSFARLPRKCDYWTDRHTDGWTDRQRDRRRKKLSLCAAMLRRRHNKMIRQVFKIAMLFLCFPQMVFILYSFCYLL